MTAVSAPSAVTVEQKRFITVVWNEHLLVLGLSLIMCQIKSEYVS